MPSTPAQPHLYQIINSGWLSSKRTRNLRQFQAKLIQYAGKGVIVDQNWSMKVSLPALGCGTSRHCAGGRSPGAPVRALRRGRGLREGSGSRGLETISLAGTDSMRAGPALLARPSTRPQQGPGSTPGPSPGTLSREVAPCSLRSTRARIRRSVSGSASCGDCGTCPWPTASGSGTTDVRSRISCAQWSRVTQASPGGFPGRMP